MSSLFDFDNSQDLVFQAKTAGKQIISAKHEALTKLGAFLFLAHSENEFALRCQLFDNDINTIANRRLATVSDSKGKLVRALFAEWQLRHASCNTCKFAAGEASSLGRAHGEGMQCQGCGAKSPQGGLGGNTGLCLGCESKSGLKTPAHDYQGNTRGDTTASSRFAKDEHNFYGMTGSCATCGGETGHKGGMNSIHEKNWHCPPGQCGPGLRKPTSSIGPKAKLAECIYCGKNLAENERNPQGTFWGYSRHTGKGRVMAYCLDEDTCKSNRTASKGDLATCAECDRNPATHKDVHGYLELCDSCFKKKSASRWRLRKDPTMNGAIDRGGITQHGYGESSIMDPTGTGHGSMAGYNSHTQKGEAPCFNCAAWHSGFSRRRLLDEAPFTDKQSSRKFAMPGGYDDYTNCDLCDEVKPVTIQNWSQGEPAHFLDGSQVCDDCSDKYSHLVGGTEASWPQHLVEKIDQRYLEKKEINQRYLDNKKSSRNNLKGRLANEQMSLFEEEPRFDEHGNPNEAQKEYMRNKIREFTKGFGNGPKEGSRKAKEGLLRHLLQHHSNSIDKADDLSELNDWELADYHNDDHEIDDELNHDHKNMKHEQHTAGMAERTCENCDAPVERRFGEDTSWQPLYCRDCENAGVQGRTFEGSAVQIMPHPISVTPFGYRFYPDEEEHQVMRAPAAFPSDGGGNCICREGVVYNNCPVHGSNKINDHYTIHDDWRGENSNLNSDW